MRRTVHRLAFSLVSLLGGVLLVVVLTGTPATPVIAVPHRPASHHPALPLVPQSTNHSTPVTEVHTVTVDGVARTYRTVVTTQPAGKLPLLIVLHGRGQSGSSVLSMTGFIELVQQQQAVLLLPDGQQRSWNAGHGCCGFAGAHQAADVPFVAAIVADALRRWPIDAQRVYLVGYSNGGKLAYSAVCAHPELFTAVATYGAVPLSPCVPGTPAVSVLLAAGTADRVLPFHGKPAGHPPLPSVAQALTWLRTQDGCSAKAQTVRDGAAVVQRWAGCAGGTDVESVVYPGRGHAWPSGGSPATATLMWTFLSRHEGHGAPRPG
ncbi:MAG TPA: PHB depolymerase family esterase [Pseudonocardiaceae bacterium]|jgi:polyhydroxybutyrate depolymerase|nr:PHB depolymerase family esterase [Pseudonocardiaceae bacterium]